MAGVQEPGDHAGGQFRLGRESNVLADSGVPAAVGVGRPGARDMQFPVHCRVPEPAGVDQVDGYLGILDPARSAGVLTLDADGAGAL
jgi:hypothetical protein